MNCANEEQKHEWYYAGKGVYRCKYCSATYVDEDYEG